MKTIDKIPSSKIGRAAKIVQTGIKVGGNYASYYGEKIFNPNLTKEKLDENNAKDIYKGLSQLKGSALKVAQMLSMEKNIIPQAYSKEFSQAQYSVPPLSPPLVKKTFKKYVGKSANEVFDAFDFNSYKAASMGQVHKATIGEKTLAVKLQYPGVAESISSDLSLVKPFAIKMFNLKGKDSEKFFQEVEDKLIEETDYKLELKRSIQISESCIKIDKLVFPKYFKEYSGKKVITMSWIDGDQFSEFINKDPSQEIRNELGQALWNFYMYQMFELKMVHADPHPGNFIITEEGKLGVIDFGCIKVIPKDFHKPYFQLTQKDFLDDAEKFDKNLRKLEILRKDDSPKEAKFFKQIFHEMLSLFSLPFQQEEFDFSNDNFLDDLSGLGEKYSQDEDLRKANGNRGSKHLLYMNRTFFGLYNLLFDLKATVKVNDYKKLML
jgi:predicted unusual protein kinase regulating ubiquinone biosynthesis (AarF/ABC1/UbiB family)